MGGVTEARLARWQDKTDESLLLAAVVFLAAYAIPIIHPELPPWLAAACRTTSLLVWVCSIQRSATPGLVEPPATRPAGDAGARVPPRNRHRE